MNFTGVGNLPGALVFNASLLGGLERQLKDYQIAITGQDVTRADVGAVFSGILPLVHTRAALNDFTRGQFLPTEYGSPYQINGLPNGNLNINIRGDLDSPFSF